MKISKLFHWLYAFLMFLPVFAVMICCGYVVFNKNAYKSYYGETINQEEVIDVEYQQFNNSTLYQYNSKGYVPSDIVGVDFGLSSNRLTLDNVTIVLYDGNNDISDLKQIAFSKRYYIQENYFYVVGYDSNGTQIINTPSTQINLVFTFNYLSDNLEETVFTYGNFFTYEQYNNYSYLDNVFYYSLNEVYSMPVFSWAKNSFLALPITYITGLFGMASNNVVNYYLSYWLAISIVYLVFDLVMYVPLLVHRWIDKGMIE